MRIREIVSLLSIIGCVASIGPAPAAEFFGESPGAQRREEIYSRKDAEVRAGYKIARDTCRMCHVIDPAQTNRPILRQPGPSFASIADRPNMTEASLRQLIANQNWDMRSLPVRMPKRTISERSIAQVATYIMSLRKPI